MNLARFTKSTLALITLACLSVTTQSDSFGFGDDSDEGDKGFYLALGISRISADASPEFDNAKLDFSDSDNAFNYRAGYMFTNWVGVEAGYYDFGEFEDSLEDAANDLGLPNTDVDLDLKGYSLQLVGNVPVSFFDFYVKGGVVRLDGTASASAFGLNYSTSESTTEPFAAIGIELDLGTVNFFGEYSRVMDTDDIEIDLATVGIKLEF